MNFKNRVSELIAITLAHVCEIGTIIEHRTRSVLDRYSDVTKMRSF